jgi:hypothetical protein
MLEGDNTLERESRAPSARGFFLRRFSLAQGWERPLGVLSILLWSTTLFAQWTTQNITLHGGWNAVFLELQPEPQDCDAVFASIPVETVWAWNKRFSSVQFIQDPNALIPGEPDWLFYVPPGKPDRTTISLFTLLSDHTYLIKLPNSVGTVNWTIHGRPSVRALEWNSDSLNLVGFHLDPVAPPTFQALLAASPAHAGKPLYRLNASGSWATVNAASEQPRPGEAYWVKCAGPSTYCGPLGLTLEQGRGLDYERALTEQTLKIRNVSTGPRTIVVRQLPSGTPVNADYPVLAGQVPLSYWRAYYPTNVGFTPLPAQLSSTVAAGAEWSLRLAVRRPDMEAFTPPLGITDVMYQSLLEITDGSGTRLLVPVTARGMQSYAATSTRPRRDRGGANPHPRAGLWVGNAVIHKVNQPASVSTPTEPVPVAADYQFRLLLHVDDSGQTRLLQKVVLMWTNGLTRVNTNGYREVVSPGRYVLVTDDSLVPRFGGAALRDGQPVARRFSSAAFSFRQPLGLSRTAGTDFGADGSTFATSVLVDYDDPVNPFKHQYHPDHDNLNERFDQKLPEGIESFTVNRQIQLQFTAADPENLTLAGWGDNQLGGRYRETITGLHKNTLFVEGTFRLQRASTVGILNDGL